MFRRIGRLLAFLVSGFFVWSIFFVLLFRDLPPPATPLMLLRALDGAGIDKTWRPLSAISPNLVLAAMAGEDDKFCGHDGFDWAAIRYAWQHDQRSRMMLGASTISMQTAKNLFLWPDRSWPRKVLEVYFTALIELAWSKQRIMEVYLNIVEWAPGVYGAEAAALYHFHKPASALSAGAKRRGSPPCCPTRAGGLPASPRAISSNAAPSSKPACPRCRWRHRCPAGQDAQIGGRWAGVDGRVTGPSEP